MPRIAAPALPQQPEKRGFPIIATLAPVLMSVTIWLVTQSAFALMFAALGPVVAIASLADGKRSDRRRSSSEQARFEAELRLAGEEIAEAHEVERAVIALAAFPAPRLVTPSSTEVLRWGADPAAIRVRLGAGRQPSELTLDAIGTSRGETAEHQRLRELCDAARFLNQAAILVSPGGGVGVIGLSEAGALARGIALQLAATLAPTEYALAIGDGAEPWLDLLPHPRVPSSLPGTEFRPIGGNGPRYRVATSRDFGTGGHGLEVLVRVEGATARFVRGAPPGSPATFTPAYLSHELALAWAESAGWQHHADRGAGLGNLPSSVRFDELGHLEWRGDGMLGHQSGADPADASGAGSLECAVAVSANGLLALDLVSQGPHTVIGGTTGSGKSELLVTWMLAMARRYAPDRLNLLLFDFKGGSSFTELATLPHTVGLVTDLDGDGASRAIASLAAELRFRERTLAQARVRAIGELDATTSLPRLVVVVDEFAAMAADFPELHALFADLAARGRSLGVHLVLCTQRPSGIVRDGVLANIALRISLRVNNRSDSIAVIGTDAAAMPGAIPPGRAWLARDGEEPTPVQFAIATSEDAATVRSAWGTNFLVRRPWLDPLPAVIPFRSLSRAGGGALVFGLFDDPKTQSQPPATWTPAHDGHLLVVGGAGTGKSNTLETIVAAANCAVVSVPSDLEGAWDCLIELVKRPLSAETLIVIDDLDAIASHFGPDYDRVFLDALSGLMRGSGAGRLRFAISVQRTPAQLHAVVAMCDSRLLLRMGTRQEHILAGGAASDYTQGLANGAGSWKGFRTQVALAPPAEPTNARSTSIPLVLGAVTIAVSSRPGGLANLLLEARVVELGAPGSCDPIELAATELAGTTEGAPLVLVADPDTWQSHWSALAELRHKHPLLFDQCSLAEFRALSRSRQLPPPIADERETAWWMQSGGEVSRVALPNLRAAGRGQDREH